MENNENIIFISDLSLLPELQKLSFKDKNERKVSFTCEVCHHKIEILIKTFLKKKSLTCGHCSQSKKMKILISQNKEEHIQRWKKAIKNKYNVDNIAHCEEVQKRKKEHNLEIYGTEYAIASKKVRNKIKKSFIERYGVEYPGSIPSTLKKSKITNIERYGGWYMGTQDFRDKSKKTMIEKYGVEYSAQSQEINDKKQKTNLEKYGVKETFMSNKVKEKRKKTMIEKYGAEYPMQSLDLKEKILYKAGHRRGGGFKGYSYKGISFDSTYELSYYLWLEYLGKQFIYHPDTPLSYIGGDNKEHLYMPDFLIEGIFYEIKGGCFFNKENEPYNHYTKEFWWEKYNAMKENNIIILREKDIKEAFDYVRNTYGKNFLKSCKIKKDIS